MAKVAIFCIRCGYEKTNDSDYCNQCLKEFEENPFQEERVLEPAEIRKKIKIGRIIIPILAVFLAGIVAFSIFVAVDYTNGADNELSLHYPIDFTTSNGKVSSLTLYYDVTDVDIILDTIAIKAKTSGNTLQRFDASSVTPTKLNNNTVNLNTNFDTDTWVIISIKYKPGNYFSFGSSSAIEAYFMEYPFEAFITQYQ